MVCDASFPAHKTKKIIVLGIGNLLLKDEGVGIHVLEALKEESLPENVELVDGSVMGMDLLPVIEQCDALIVIDAIAAEGIPGTIYKCSALDIESKKAMPVSLHDFDFFQVLEMAKQLKKLPPTQLIAIVPAELSWGMELSALIKDKIPILKQVILEEIKRIIL